MARIELQFDKLITSLAGNRFGREIFSGQVRDKISENEKTYVILPDRVEDVASSFVQGFYSELCEKYGVERALDMMQFQSDNQFVLDKIAESMETYGV